MFFCLVFIFLTICQPAFCEIRLFVSRGGRARKYESRALCREQRVSVSCLLCAMVPGRKAALAASGEGECKFGACPACRFDIFLLATGTCRIEKKRASKACPDFIFKKVFGR